MDPKELLKEALQMAPAVRVAIVSTVASGTGTDTVKAGPGVRDVLEVCGIRNILTKVHGSSNPINLVKATIQGLLLLRTKDEVARLRGVSL